ncbi:MAG: hypothetical protein DRN05_04710 [Thermoplasmata archaeon]|nr:MAG: hypothetical protein DRN05_04710 [Thermoplasmata archaeon]
MGRTFHRYKPQKIFEKELQTSEFYDCKEKKWVAVIPKMKYRFVIALKSDYPREVFDAPKYYMMKVVWKNGKEQVFEADTKDALGDAILRFRTNECFWNNLGRYAYRVYLDWVNKSGRLLQ